MDLRCAYVPRADIIASDSLYGKTGVRQLSASIALKQHLLSVDLTVKRQR